MAEFVNNTDLLESVLNEVSDSSLLSIFQERTEVHNYDDFVYPMCEFNSLNEGRTLLEIIEMIDKDFDTCDEYFYIDNSGEYCSTSDVKDAITYYCMMNEIADFIIDYWENVKKVISVSDFELITERAEEEFTEYAQENSDIPFDWLMLNVDNESCVVCDWEDYLQELKDDYDNEMSEEDEE